MNRITAIISALAIMTMIALGGCQQGGQQGGQAPSTMPTKSAPSGT